MIVLVLLERVVAQVAPQHGGHAKFMGSGKCGADFHNLAPALLGTEINRRAHGGRAHVVGFLNGAKENLIGFIRIGQQFVVVDFYDKGNFVRVLAGHRA